jgi:hypothetical protein
VYLRTRPDGRRRVGRVKEEGGSSEEEGGSSEEEGGSSEGGGWVE